MPQMLLFLAVLQKKTMVKSSFYVCKAEVIDREKAYSTIRTGSFAIVWSIQTLSRREGSSARNSSPTVDDQGEEGKRRVVR